MSVDFETQGRSLAQAMFSELEKIAYSSAVKNLSREAREKATTAARATDAAGLWRFVPGTQEWKTTAALNSRASQASAATDSAIKRERGDALRILQHGADSKEEQEAALRLLENRPKKDQKTGVSKVEDEKKGGMVRKALIGTGIVGAAGGSAVLGKRFLDKQKEKKQQGGFQPGGTY